MRKILIYFIYIFCLSCANGTTDGVTNYLSSAESNIDGIGISGGILKNGTLDGQWKNGCAGGAAGNNWS